MFGGADSVGAPGQGNSVALSGDGNTVIVGGPGDNNALGAAWVFSSLPALRVMPTTDIATAGNSGGPFVPSPFQYQLSASAGTVNYLISASRAGSPLLQPRAMCPLPALP
jgi:hypothetical protein